MSPHRKCWVLLITSLLAVWVVADPFRCRERPEYEASIIDISLARDYVVFARLSVDAGNQRRSILEEIRPEPRHYYHRIQLLDQLSEFSIDLQSGACTSRRLTVPWEPIGVPENATFVKSYFVGSTTFARGHVLVNDWTAIGKDFYWQGTFTDDGCVPVTSSTLNNRTGHAEMTHISFYNYVIGIQDPNVFSVPPQCPRP